MSESGCVEELGLRILSVWWNCSWRVFRLKDCGDGAKVNHHA